MPQYDNTNRGVLFNNDRKTPGDNRPDYTGKINIDGQEYFISAWNKEGAKGPYLSLARQPDKPQQQGGQGGGYGGGQRQAPRPQSQRPPARPQQDEPSFNDADIPF